MKILNFPPLEYTLHRRTEQSRTLRTAEVFQEKIESRWITELGNPTFKTKCKANISGNLVFSGTSNFSEKCSAIVRTENF